MRELEWNCVGMVRDCEINEAIAETNEEFVIRRDGKGRGFGGNKGRYEVHTLHSK